MMFVQRLASKSTLRYFATLLFILQHDVSSYHVAPLRHALSNRHHCSGGGTRLLASNPLDMSDSIDHAALSVDDIWEDHYQFQFGSDDDDNDDENERRYRSSSHFYVSQLVRDMNEEEISAYCLARGDERNNGEKRNRPPDTYIDEPYRHLRLLRRRLPDPLWSQIRLEAEHTLIHEPDAGPLLYQHVLRQPSIIDALASIIAHEIATELMPATALLALVLDQLRLIDDKNIHLDLVASVNRNPSEDSTALNALLFHQGLHALVCYRVAHRLWQAGRTGLAYYMQSTVSSRYSADIHPAAEMEGGIYLNVGGGVVIGETARVGQDVTILQGVTLGGTGKEVGDRHPKVEDGVILHCGATVLGNLRVGKGAVVTAKSIVTKEVPALARVSGVPATVKSYRKLRKEGFGDGEVTTADEHETKECDLDCKMRKRYESYFMELDKLVEMESCIDSGNENSREYCVITEY